jgi:hypothetical protein
VNISEFSHLANITDKSELLLEIKSFLEKLGHVTNGELTPDSGESEFPSI